MAATKTIRADRLRYADRVVFDGGVRAVESVTPAFQPGAVCIEFLDGTRAPLVDGRFHVPRVTS